LGVYVPPAWFSYYDHFSAPPPTIQAFPAPIFDGGDVFLLSYCAPFISYTAKYFTAVHPSKCSGLFTTGPHRRNLGPDRAFPFCLKIGASSFAFFYLFPPPVIGLAPTMPQVCSPCDTRSFTCCFFGFFFFFFSFFFFCFPAVLILPPVFKFFMLSELGGNCFCASQFGRFFFITPKNVPSFWPYLLARPPLCPFEQWLLVSTFPRTFPPNQDNVHLPIASCTAPLTPAALSDHFYRYLLIHSDK